MASILWKGPGNTLDRSTLNTTRRGYRLAGTVLTGRNGIPLEVRYVLMTDPSWQPRDVGIHILGGEPDARLALSGDGEGTWTLDGNELADLSGCLDVALGFSPAALTLVVNRLGTGAADRATTSAVFIGYPGEPVRAVELEISRVDERSYRVGIGGRERELRLNSDGLATSYDDWEAVASR